MRANPAITGLRHPRGRSVPECRPVGSPVNKHNAPIGQDFIFGVPQPILKMTNRWPAQSARMESSTRDVMEECMP